MQEKPFNTINQKISIEPLKNKYPKDQIRVENIDPLQDQIKLQYTYLENNNVPNIAEISEFPAYPTIGLSTGMERIFQVFSVRTKLKIYFRNGETFILLSPKQVLKQISIVDLFKAGTVLLQVQPLNNTVSTNVNYHLQQKVNKDFLEYFEQYLIDHNKNQVDLENNAYMLSFTKSDIADLTKDFLTSYKFVDEEYFTVSNSRNKLDQFKKTNYKNNGELGEQDLKLNQKKEIAVVEQFLSDENLTQFIAEYFPNHSLHKQIIELINKNVDRYLVYGKVDAPRLVKQINLHLFADLLHETAIYTNISQKQDLSIHRFLREGVLLFIEKYFSNNEHKKIVMELAKYACGKFFKDNLLDEAGLNTYINEVLSRNFLYLNSSFANVMEEMRDGRLIRWDKNKFDELLASNGYALDTISIDRINRCIREQLPSKGSSIQLQNVKNIYFIVSTIDIDQSFFNYICNKFGPQLIKLEDKNPSDNLQELTVEKLTNEVSKTIPGIAEHRIKLFSESFIAMKRGTIKAQMQRELEESERTINSQDLAEFTRYVKDVLLYESHATLKDLFDHYLTEFRDYQNPPIAWPEFNSYWKEYRNLYKSKFDRVYAKNRTNVQVAMPVELVGDFLQFLYDMSVKKLKFARGTRDLQTKEQMQQSFIQYIESWREKSRLSQETK